MFSRGEFTYDAERDVYVCPNGKLLRTSGTDHDSRVRNYLSQPQECRACTLKQRCTRAPFKKIARDINEDARNHARSLKGTPEFERSSNARKKGKPPRRDALRRGGLMVENCTYGQSYDQCVEST